MMLYFRTLRNHSLLHVAKATTKSCNMSHTPNVQELIDSMAPTGVYLRGKYKKSSAYHSFTNRIPNIIDSVVGNVRKDEKLLVQEYGKAASGDVDAAIKGLCQLKSEVLNNGCLEPLKDKELDSEAWNRFLDSIKAEERAFYYANWMYGECYVYRRMVSCFKQTGCLQNYDFFRLDKDTAMMRSEMAMLNVLKATRQTQKDAETLSKLLKLNLWGNQADLSLDITKTVSPANDLLSQLEDLDSKLLVDETCQVWEHLNRSQKSCVVDVICDNAAFELFTDLVLAEYLLEKGFASKVRFHVKALPWYISDVTSRDFFRTLLIFRNHKGYAEFRQFGQQLCQYMTEGRIELAPPDYFWTGPYEFCRMPLVNASLYQSLGDAHLMLVKGDLNYRKLLRDFNCPVDEEFSRTLGGFGPTSLCSLRTVKADLICGVSPQTVEEIYQKQPNWMISGDYGTIHFASKDSLHR